MTLQSDELTEVTTRQNLYELRGDGNALQKFLRIQPPDNVSKTPPILAFRRKREIEIPWGEIVDDEDVTGAVSTAAIRKYFEDSWGVKVDEKWMDDSEHRLMGNGSESWRVKELRAGEEPSIYRPDFDKLDDKGGPTPVKVTEGFVIRHGSGENGRLYLLINEKKTLSPKNFETWALYNSAWDKEIDGVELVFGSEVDAQSYYMDFEEIDLRPILIQRKYEELRILREFAKKVKDNVSDITEKMIKQMIETTVDADELEQLQRKVMRLEIGEYDVQKRIERLVSDAARLGYLRFTNHAPEEIKHRDDEITTLEPGKLYTTYKRTARWTEYILKPVVTRSWFLGFPIVKKVKVPHPHEQVVEDYQVVDTSRDTLAETRTAMIKAGQKVYVFEQTPSGLVSAEGVPLRQIMDRCKYDEAFRRTCVVMLPVYDESLTGQRLLVKYAIYKRPLPGLVPSILPRLSLEESLAYRTAWVQTQLGELLNSINLAPGEERKVTITKRFEQETTVTRTSTSIFDINRAETSDLATEMENQTRQEQESSRSMQVSTKASGGIGTFHAEASASGGTSSSLKDMSQAISKVANKAAKSVSSQNREEVTSTSTARTTISNTDETVATIQNINQGRSLNLMFYSLYNKYTGGLYLEGLRFAMIPSVEVIAGSGVHESRSYSLEELPNLIAEFKAAQLPFAIKDDGKYTTRLLDSIEVLLRTEYEDAGGEDAKRPASDTTPKDAATNTPTKPRAEATSLSVARLSIPPAAVLGTRVKAGSADAKSGLAELSESLRRTVIHSDDPIAPQELLVTAPGLYLDAVVGLLPSTEPYSERMREQEVQMRAAEVAVKKSESDYQRAMALRLLQMRAGWDFNCLTGVLATPNQKSLTLSLMLPLLPGDWYLQVDKKDKEKVETTDVSRHILAFSWNEKQDWLEGDDLLSRIALVNKTSDDTIMYPNTGTYNKIADTGAYALSPQTRFP